MFVLVIFGLPASCIYFQPIKLLPKSERVVEKTEEEKLSAERRLQVVQAERIVKGQLKDPKSAEFSGLYHSGKAVCGAVNAKNSFGGYTGFTRFITRGRVVVMDDGSRDFARGWAEFC